MLIQGAWTAECMEKVNRTLSAHHVIINNVVCSPIDGHLLSTTTAPRCVMSHLSHFHMLYPDGEYIFHWCCSLYLLALRGSRNAKVASFTRDSSPGTLRSLCISAGSSSVVIASVIYLLPGPCLMPWVPPETPLWRHSTHIAVGCGLRLLVKSKAMGIECDRCSFETWDFSPGTLDLRLHLVQFNP